MNFNTYERHQKLLDQIIASYDSWVVRTYCRIRFTIININILHILALCLRGKRQILEIGCGFGLFGCYFASLFPEIEYQGIDLNPSRIAMAQRSAQKLGLKNVRFSCGDARSLALNGRMDAILMIDLLHHLEEPTKLRLVNQCANHLQPDGRLIIKDVATRPAAKLFFTWALDVLMTRGFEMWYWDEKQMVEVLQPFFQRTDTFPITDWMPYPHIVYLNEGLPAATQVNKPA